MKRFYFTLLLAAFLLTGAQAQQIMYPNLKSLIEEQGDTVTTLRVEKRTKNLIYMWGGADYRISVDENSGMSRYLKSRCYAVRVDTSLYVNCRKMRYKRYRFGNWYAPAMWVKGKIYFSAVPLGQAATESSVPESVNKLRGQIGDAINVSGLVDERVYYELDPETGKSDFVSRDKMRQLLQGHPDLLKAFERETGESAQVMGHYLRALR